MARVFVNDSTLTDIADAIREKNGTEDTYKPSQMADAVRAIISNSSNLPNIMVSEVIIDQESATADVTKSYLENLVVSTMNFSVFVNKKTLKNDIKLFSSNETIYFLISPIGGGYGRYRDGIMSTGNNMGTAYDLGLNVGEEYYLIEIISEGSDA